MLTRKTPDILDTNITINSQGETIKLHVVYHNRAQAEFDAKWEETKGQWKLTDQVLFIVKEWESEYELTTADLEALEGDRPGVLIAIVSAFFRARQAELVKN